MLDSCLQFDDAEERRILLKAIDDLTTSHVPVTPVKISFLLEWGLDRVRNALLKHDLRNRLTYSRERHEKSEELIVMILAMKAA